MTLFFLHMCVSLECKKTHFSLAPRSAHRLSFLLELIVDLLQVLPDMNLLSV